MFASLLPRYRGPVPGGPLGGEQVISVRANVIYLPPPDCRVAVLRARAGERPSKFRLESERAQHPDAISEGPLRHLGLRGDQVEAMRHPGMHVQLDGYARPREPAGILDVLVP